MASPAQPPGTLPPGMQKVSKTLFTYAQALQELQRQEGKNAKWSKLLKAVRSGPDGAGPAMLQCKCCGKQLSAANPHDTMQRHQGACKPPAAAAAGADGSATPSGHAEAGPSFTPASTSASHAARGQLTLQEMIPSTRQRNEAISNLAMFFFTTSTPFLRFENQYLRDAFLMFGVELPSETTLRRRLLDEGFQRTEAKVEVKMRASNGRYQLITDAWRNKHCARSAPIITIVTTLPDGGSVFHEVRQLVHAAHV